MGGGWTLTDMSPSATIGQALGCVAVTRCQCQDRGETEPQVLPPLVGLTWKPCLTHRSRCS